MLHLPPTIAQLFGDVVQAAPSTVPPQRFTEGHVPVQLALLMLQGRLTLGHAVVEQSAPVELQVFTVAQSVADMHEFPFVLHVPAIVGQFALLVQDVPVWILHLPMSVQIEALAVQSRLDTLHFLLHCWTSVHTVSGLPGSQPGGDQTSTQLDASTLQLCGVKLHVCVLTLLQVWPPYCRSARFRCCRSVRPGYTRAGYRCMFAFECRCRLGW